MARISRLTWTHCLLFVFSGRDVAEKYLGRHVAFHHHYMPNYDKGKFHCTIYSAYSSRHSKLALNLLDGGSSRGASHQTSCLQMRLDSTGRVLMGREAATEAEQRIDGALQSLESDLQRVSCLYIFPGDPSN